MSTSPAPQPPAEPTETPEVGAVPPPRTGTFDPGALAARPDLVGWFFRLPRGWRLATYALFTRGWAALLMVIGSHWPNRHLDYWNGHQGKLFFKQLPIRILDVWGRWDTDFYVAIAKEGYPHRLPGEQWVYTAAYFPLLPSMMRGLSVLLGGASVYLCGIFIANATVALAIIYYDKLLRLDRAPEVAELGVICLLAYPGSHFLSCVYPESMALFLAVFAVWCARHRLDLAAGLACGLAAIDRSSGALICIAVLYELCRRDDGKLRLTWRVWIFVFPLLTLAWHMAQNWLVYADPIYFVHVQAGWGRHPAFALATLFHSEFTPDYQLFALCGVLLVGAMYKLRARPGYTALATANMALPLSTGILAGIHRYMASNFPLFFTLADLLQHRRRARWAYLVIGFLLLSFFSFKWGQGYHPC